MLMRRAHGHQVQTQERQPKQRTYTPSVTINTKENYICYSHIKPGIMMGMDMSTPPLYRRWANHYLHAIQSGALSPGERMPSVRKLMQTHGISLSTALQVCRVLEEDGWLEARPRSGYFVQLPKRTTVPLDEPSSTRVDPAQFVGIHDRVSRFILSRRQHPIALNLCGSRGEPDFYPVKALHKVAQHCLRLYPEVLVTPVANSGHSKLRHILARRSLARGMTLSPDDIVITHGCTEALNLALRAVAKPGDTIAVESPTFYGLLQILESLGMRALEIPTSPQHGISLDALELAMQTYDNIRAVVVIPILQNPLGSLMPDSHKARLAEMCAKANIPLIEDDTYGELADSPTPAHTLKAWDRNGNIIYCTSLHKTLAPGMRLGWISAGRWQARVDMLKHTQTRQNEGWSQLAAAEYLGSSAYDRHMHRLKALLRQQRQRTAEVIARHFPPGTRLTNPAGGFSLWVELPDRIPSEAVFEAALNEGILIAPGVLFSNSNRWEHYLRINCGVRFGTKVEAGLIQLGQIVHTLLQQSRRTRNSPAVPLAG